MKLFEIYSSSQTKIDQLKQSKRRRQQEYAQHINQNDKWFSIHGRYIYPDNIMDQIDKIYQERLKSIDKEIEDLENFDRGMSII